MINGFYYILYLNICLVIRAVLPMDIIIPIRRSALNKLTTQVRVMDRGVFGPLVTFDLDTTNAPFSTGVDSDEDSEPTRLLLGGTGDSFGGLIVEITNPFEQLLIDEGDALSIGFGTDFARQIGSVILESDRMILRPSNISLYVSNALMARSNVFGVFSSIPHHVFTSVSVDGFSEEAILRLSSMHPRFPISAEQRTGLMFPRVTYPTVYPLDLNFGDFMTNLIPIREFLVIQNTIEQNGGRLVREGGGLHLMSHHPLSDFVAVLPNIRYSIFNDRDGREIVAEFLFTPEDYLGHQHDHHTCQFFLEYARESPYIDSPTVLSLTAYFLQHVGLLFDYDNNQIGFFDTG